MNHIRRVDYGIVSPRQSTWNTVPHGVSELKDAATGPSNARTGCVVAAQLLSQSAP